LLDACKATRPAEVWHSAFGDMMEMACREVALDAQAAPRFRDRVVLSKSIGDADEIEDVVIHGSTGLALFSAKASRIEHAVARGALSRHRVLQWIHAFLFAAKSKRHRGGALRLLDAKVDRIRAGAWPNVPWPADVPVFPALVSFDDIGDGIGIVRMIEQRCAEFGLLQQPGVAPVALLSLDDLEGLLALATRGRSIPELLALKASPARREQPFKSFLLDESDSKHLRLPVLKQRAKDLFERSVKTLFNQAAPVLDPDEDDDERA